MKIGSLGADQDHSYIFIYFNSMVMLSLKGTLTLNPFRLVYQTSVI